MADIPETSSTPDTPETSQAPEEIETPQAPETSATTETSETPEACPPYKIELKPPQRRNSRQYTVTIIDCDGKTVAEKSYDLSQEDRVRAAGRFFAGRLRSKGISAPDEEKETLEHEVERKLEEEWAARADQRREQEAAAEAGDPNAAPPQQPPLITEPQYVVMNRAIYRIRQTAECNFYDPLCNFEARIIEQITEDDGVEQKLSLVIEGQLQNGQPLPRVEVPTSEFARLGWVVPRWGTCATVFAGQGVQDHLRCALQVLSAGVQHRTIYTHLGWRHIGDCWVYLHAGGWVTADGVDGVDGQIEVVPPEPLVNYVLPTPPEGDVRVEAIRSCLDILGLNLDRITIPLLGAVYRSVLGSADFALHMVGPTGAGKTELAALAQQHFGASLDARHLPGSWSSTGNSLESLGFSAKDALLTVDDFAPSGSSSDIQRFHKEADRIIRAQGNNSGRGRCRTDGSHRVAKPPRGLILSTGEDIPKGQSLRARLLILEVGPGELLWSHLTGCQRDAAAGRYAAALAGYLRWLASRYATVRDGLRAETAALRERLQADNQHARTPGILADLVIGWRYWLDYALESGAINENQRTELAKRVWRALQEAGADQAEHIQAAEPTGLFLRLLAGAIASGRAHVADGEGEEPINNPQAWGWREKIIGAGDKIRHEWQPQGRRLGWLADELLYLDPDAAYAEANELARLQGESLPVLSRTLWVRLQQKGLLADRDKTRKRNTVRRSLEGMRHREVIALHPDSISCLPPSTPSTDQPTTFANGVPKGGSANGTCGRSESSVDGTPSTVDGQDDSTVHKHNGQKGGEGHSGGRCGRSTADGNGSRAEKHQGVTGEEEPGPSPFESESP